MDIKSEFVKYKEEDYILLDIVNTNGREICNIWNLNDGKCINVEKEELSKHELETIDFGSLEDEFGQEMSFNIGISVEDDSGVDLVQTVEGARRHRSLDQDGLDEISKANTEIATDYQTKWAVKIFKGICCS